ncbi:hypothetical protein [uncultured Corynebacterium sp.]|uniref:hypothetical protein n=1 Tax=uncultured Corynebacterium sp. TaxID=159447 RepID=UPI00259B3559|nr:hypothetical protein [uncultured Corynebacterium sp.]
MHTEMANRLPNIIRKWAKAKANFETTEPHNFREWARVERTIDEIIYEFSMGLFDSFGVYEYRNIRDAANRLADELIEEGGK